MVPYFAVTNSTVNAQIELSSEKARRQEYINSLRWAIEEAKAGIETEIHCADTALENYMTAADSLDQDTIADILPRI